MRSINKTITLKAAAKINLFLEISGTLDNGYHKLKTVMQSVSLFDIVRITQIDQPFITVSTSDPIIPQNEKNIAFAAAKAFLEYCKLPAKNLDIQIEKNIPSKAGLGGGSADAAGVILGLNQLLSTDIPLEKLIKIGGSIGADVPFCILGGSCLAEGIGEKLTKLNPIAQLENWIVIVKPSDGVSTPQAFGKYDSMPQLHNHKQRETRMLEAVQKADLFGVGASMYNVFEKVLASKDTENIKSIMLNAGGLGSGLSGSGSSVAGIFDRLVNAKIAKETLARVYEKVFLVNATSCGTEILE